MLTAAISLLCSVNVDGVPGEGSVRDVKDDPFLNDTFPDGFLWGVATAAYQVEGGWDADGKCC